MAQLLFSEVGATWTGAGTLETLTAGKIYEIQNRGGDALLVNISSDTPDNLGGRKLKAGESYETVYNSGDIYLRAESGSCFVNINEKEEISAE